MSKVVDLSLHNGTINFVHMRETGVEDVILRASMGYAGYDYMFSRNAEQAWQAGLGVGAYHLWDSRISARGQYNNFVRQLEASMAAGDVTLQYFALDVEEKTMRNGAMMDAMYDWLTLCQIEWGITPYIYTSWGLWSEWQNNGKVYWASNYPLWVADYDNQQEPDIPSDWHDWSLWQYSGNGNLLGHDYGTYSWSVDLNRRNEPLDNIREV